MIESYDFDDTCVYVQRTKDEIKNAPEFEIKNAPEFDPDQVNDLKYRQQFGPYYGPGGRGYVAGTRTYSRPMGTRAR